MDKSEDELKLPIVPANNNSLVPQPEQEYPLAFPDLALNSILSGADYYLDPENAEYLSIPEEVPELVTHPFLTQDREFAFSLLNELILSAVELNKQMLETLKGPACPYQRTLHEYLGPNHKYPTIAELPLPTTFSFPQINETISTFQNHVEETMSDHIDIMVKEAADTGFPGITSQNLANAFSVLSGNEYVIDKNKLCKHLEFGEIVRNIPQDYIDNHPYLTSFKILSRYSEITLT